MYESFKAWVEADVLQLPAGTQLDGGNVSSRAIVARFTYKEALWQVHGDTRVDLVCRAYKYLCDNPDGDPFVIELTERRKNQKQRDCLNLIPELQNAGRKKHFYAYRQ